MLTTLQKKLAGLDTSRSALRSFGCSVGGVLIVLAGIIAWRTSTLESGWVFGLAVVGTGLIGSGVVVPAALRPVYKVWMGSAYVMSMVMTPVLLIAIYLFIVVPVGSILRLSAHDPMDRRLEEDRDSYWTSPSSSSNADERLEKYY